MPLTPFLLAQYGKRWSPCCPPLRAFGPDDSSISREGNLAPNRFKIGGQGVSGSGRRCGLRSPGGFTWRPGQLRRPVTLAPIRSPALTFCSQGSAAGACGLSKGKTVRTLMASAQPCDLASDPGRGCVLGSADGEDHRPACRFRACSAV